MIQQLPGDLHLRATGVARNLREPNPVTMHADHPALFARSIWRFTPVCRGLIVDGTLHFKKEVSQADRGLMQFES